METETITHVIYCGKLCQYVVIVCFSLQAAPEIKLTASKIRGISKAEPFRDDCFQTSHL
jgi:hypothetical protein